MTEPVTSTIALKPCLSKSLNYNKYDVFDGEYKLFQKILAELIGTTQFVYGVCARGIFYTGHHAVGILVGACIGGIMIYIFGRVSDAHFNPAVSLALFIRHKLSCIDLMAYIIAQIIVDS